MKQQDISFATKENVEFIKELRQKVSEYFNTNNLSKQGNSKLLLKTIFMFTLYLAPYLLMLTGVINSLGLVFVAWIVMGLGMAGIGMAVMHDANHFSYSKNKTINKIMSYSLFMVGGFPTNWQHQHNTLHHGYTNIDGMDEDISPPVSLLRFSPHKPLQKIHKFQFLYAWFFYGMMTLMWATSKDFKQLNRYFKSDSSFGTNKSYTKLLVEIILSKAIYYIILLALPMLMLPFAWYWIVLFFLVMQFTAGFILTIIFQTAHVVPTSEYPLPNKEGSMENNWAVHQLHTTSDFAPNNKILSWLIGGLNFQVVHHLFPNISHVHYPKISKLVQSMTEKYNLPYHVQPGFFKALWEHTKMLKRLGTA
ncbi:MAG: acyl-CoA desaturase [Salinivirgaceae bacterium]|nr:acyl-CoA desaturase [Salinivirgaceae bacterium]